MRKYDKKNKINFIVILVVSIILIVIFSFFLNKVITNAKINYTINAASVMYDKDKNLFRIDEDATLKKKWNDTYYLNYKKDMINLGQTAIIYNPSKSQMNLYGRFYEIAKDHEDKIIIHDDETLVNVNESKFYKIADRKYLLIDKTIKDNNNKLSTSNYLIVELDKQGNALLYNNTINMKTFKETILETSTYKFNIAEEKLNIGNEEVDLKKIIGSTNKYVKEEELKEDNNDKNNNTQNNQNQNGNQTVNNNQINNNGNNNTTNNNANNNTTNNNANNQTNNNTDNQNNDNNNNQNDNTGNNDNQGNNNTNPDDSSQSIIKATKTTSIVSIKANVGYLSIDYVVYDPLDEYESVFVEIYDEANNLVAVNYFDKNANNLVVPGLKANTRYNLVFKYSYYEDKQRKEVEFDRSSVMMSSPNLSVVVSKVTASRIYYTVYLDKDYKLDSLKVNLKSGSVSKSNTITSPNKDTIEGYFEYDEVDSYVNIYLSDVIYKGYQISTNASYKIAMP